MSIRNRVKPTPGQVVFDRRGNPVWEWNSAEGDSTSVLLKQLENDDLALEPTRTVHAVHPPQVGAKARPSVRRGDSREEAGLELEESAARSGFDPYNRS